MNAFDIDDGWIEISAEELNEYFEKHCVFQRVAYGDGIAYKRPNHGAIAFKTNEGKCYSKTKYWCVQQLDAANKNGAS